MENKTIVIKIGTSTLTGGTKKIKQAHILEIVRQCVLALRQGIRVIVVTSGAIAAGREHLNYPELPPTIASKQLLAAVGQSQLIQVWERLFSIYDVHVGQMLLTRADLEDRERFINARDMLLALLANDIIPIVNENDAVAVSEIKVGDNDNLSALVAILAGADTLILLTDQEGLYTDDPRNNPKATLIAEVEEINKHIRILAGDSATGLGTGGMATKIQAAEIATRAGIEVIVASGDKPELIAKIIAGEAVGTYFHPKDHPLEARKRWIFGAAPAGVLRVDAGAAKSILERGASLLPKGILECEGIFRRGAVVQVVDPEGKKIAHGTVRYSNDALLLIKGLHSDKIAETLGYEYGAVVIHRDDLITLGS